MLLKQNFLRWFCLLLLGSNQALMAHEVKPVLRVLFEEDSAPFAYRKDRNSSTLGGYGYAGTDWVLTYAKFRYVWDTYPMYPFTEEYSNQYRPIGLLTGLEHSRQLLGESTVMDTLTVSMVIPYPEEKPKLWSFAYPFSTSVWVCVLLSAALIGGCAKAINLSIAPEETFDGPFMFILQVTIGQGGSCTSSRFNLRILAATWSVAALILSNVYLSLLVSLFSLPYRVPLAENLQQVLDNGLAALFTKDSFEEGTFKTAPPDSIYYRIYEKTRDSVVCIDENYTTSCVDWLLEKKYAVTFMARADGEIWYEDLVSRNNCRLTSIDLQGMPTSYDGMYMMPKGHPYHRNVSLGMLRLREYGLQVPMRMQENAYRKCTCCNWKHDRPLLSKLRIADLAGIFGILGVGYGAAFLVFLLEVLTGRKSVL